ICLDAEAGAVVARADADLGRHGGLGGNLHPGLAGDEFERAKETGGVAGGEELLGVGAGGAVAAEFLGRGERDGERAVVGLGGAGAAAGGGGLGGVENFQDRKSTRLNSSHVKIS